MRNISTHGHPSDGRRRGEPGIRYSDAQRRRKTRTRTGSHCRSSSTKPKGSSSVPMASQKSNSRQQVFQSHLRNPIARSSCPCLRAIGMPNQTVSRIKRLPGRLDVAWLLPERRHWRVPHQGPGGGAHVDTRGPCRKGPGRRREHESSMFAESRCRCWPGFRSSSAAYRRAAIRKARSRFRPRMSWRSLLDTGHHRERQGRKSWRRRSTRRRTPAASMSTCSSRVRMPAQCSSRTDSWKSCSHKTRSFFPREAETVPWARSWPARLAERSGYSSSTTSPTAIVPPVTTALSSATRPPKSSTMRWSTPRSWACVSGS